MPKDEKQEGRELVELILVGMDAADGKLDGVFHQQPTLKFLEPLLDKLEQAPTLEYGMKNEVMLAVRIFGGTADAGGPADATKKVGADGSFDIGITDYKTCDTYKRSLQTGVPQDIQDLIYEKTLLCGLDDVTLSVIRTNTALLKNQLDAADGKLDGVIHRQPALKMLQRMEKTAEKISAPSDQQQWMIGALLTMEAEINAMKKPLAVNAKDELTIPASVYTDAAAVGRETIGIRKIVDDLFDGMDKADGKADKITHKAPALAYLKKAKAALETGQFDKDFKAMFNNTIGNIEAYVNSQPVSAGDVVNMESAPAAIAKRPAPSANAAPTQPAVAAPATHLLDNHTPAPGATPKRQAPSADLSPAKRPAPTMRHP